MTDDLLTRLAAATEGSRELDIAIAMAVFPKLERRHASYYLAGERVSIEPFTTSLDAALPWENIVDVSLSVEGEWAAVHRNEEGSICEGKAHTEPLARRIAALKAKEQSDE